MNRKKVSTWHSTGTEDELRRLYARVIDGLERLYAALEHTDTPGAECVMAEADADILLYSSFLAQYEVSILYPDNPFVME